MQQKPYLLKEHERTIIDHMKYEFSKKLQVRAPKIMRYWFCCCHGNHANVLKMRQIKNEKKVKFILWWQIFPTMSVTLLTKPTTKTTTTIIILILKILLIITIIAIIIIIAYRKSEKCLLCQHLKKRCKTSAFRLFSLHQRTDFLTWFL